MSHEFSQETIDAARTLSFLDDEPDFAPEPFAVVDRSTLERYSQCPAQARYVDAGFVLNESTETAVGSEVHEALSEAVREFHASRGAMNAADLADVVRSRLLNSRPDVQPLVLEAARRSVWDFAKYLDGMAPTSIVRYDGGIGDKSGQLAWDIPHLNTRVTSEVDLLHAGPAKEVLHEIDYKSGHGQWTATDVSRAFQFAMHAWLILHNYEHVQAVEIRIWNTRTNRITYGVDFERRQLPELDARVTRAAAEWVRWRDVEPQNAPTLPAATKCELCRAAALCPVVPPSEIDADPKEFVRRLNALQIKVDALSKIATAYVDRTGADIVTDDGLAFGRAKPKAERKTPATLYTKGD